MADATLEPPPELEEEEEEEYEEEEDDEDWAWSSAGANLARRYNGSVQVRTDPSSPSFLSVQAAEPLSRSSPTGRPGPVRLRCHTCPTKL